MVDGGERMNTPQESKSYPKAPRGEIMREYIVCPSGAAFAITCNDRKDKFFLYRVDERGGISKRMKSAKSPVELQALVM